MKQQNDQTPLQPWLSIESQLSDKQDSILAVPRDVPAAVSILARLKIPHSVRSEPLGANKPSFDLLPQEQDLYQAQRANTVTALKACALLTREVATNRSALRDLLSQSRATRCSNEKLFYSAAIQTVRDNLKDLERRSHELAERNPEAFYVLHSQQFRKYSRQLSSGRLALTRFVTDKIDEACAVLSSTRMLILHGPTGSGKTEVAQIIAQIVSGKPPLLISGHRDLSAREMKGHDVLKSSSTIAPEIIPDVIEKAKDQYKQRHPSMSGRQLEQALAQIEARFLRQNAVTESEFVLGYAYKAAELGRTLIIDEFDLIPRAVLMGLNALMTKRPGETIDVVEDNRPPVVVAPGFSIIMTGNLNTGRGATYLDREAPDASTINRFLPIEYGFLPQTTEGSVTDARPEDKQLYEVILCTLRSGRPFSHHSGISPRIEDRALIVNAPGGRYCLEKLWRLAKYAAITQLALEGKVTNSSPYAHYIDGIGMGPTVSHALTPRVVVNLLNQWKDSGFEFELDHYIFTALIGSAVTAEERDYFYRQGQLQGFFMSPGWPTVNDTGSGKLHCDVTSPRNPREGEPTTIPGRFLVSEIYGPAPERVVWPYEGTPRSEGDDLQIDAGDRIATLIAAQKALEASSAFV